MPPRNLSNNVIRFLKKKVIVLLKFDVILEMLWKNGEYFLNEGNVKKWCWKFNTGWAYFHAGGENRFTLIVALGWIQQMNPVIRTKKVLKSDYFLKIFFPKSIQIQD